LFATPAEVISACREEGIRFLLLRAADLAGQWREVAVPVARANERLFTQGVGFDASNYGYASIESSDMVLLPDPSTAFVDPFRREKSLVLLCDVLSPAGGADKFPFDPRGVAKKAVQQMKQLGAADQERFLPELEFYIFDRVVYEVSPFSVGFQVESLEGHGGSSRDGSPNPYSLPAAGGYHAVTPGDRHHDLRAEMSRLAEEAGVPIKYHHHEVGGAGQQELEILPGSLVRMADAVLTVKYIVHNVAARSGLSATFMPKPLEGHPGNGQHVHIQLFRQGSPLFYDGEGYAGLSTTALQFMGGVLHHSPALLALTNPSTNSFKRLVPGYEAPVSVCFGRGNRSSVVRVPAYAREPEDVRFEFRPPDATCNPYLAFAALLMAGMDGIRKGIDPVGSAYGPYDRNVYELSPEERRNVRNLPADLDQALDELERDGDFLYEGEVFPPALVELWVANLREHARRVRQCPHPLEYRMYYSR